MLNIYDFYNIAIGCSGLLSLILFFREKSWLSGLLATQLIVSAVLEWNMAYNASLLEHVERIYNIYMYLEIGLLGAIFLFMINTLKLKRIYQFFWLASLLVGVFTIPADISYLSYSTSSALCLFLVLASLIVFVDLLLKPSAEKPLYLILRFWVALAYLFWALFFMLFVNLRAYYLDINHDDLLRISLLQVYINVAMYVLISIGISLRIWYSSRPSL